MSQRNVALGEPDSGRLRPYVVVGSVLGLLHLCLFVFDVFSPDGFLRADRAEDRIKFVRRIIEAIGNPDVLVDTLVRQGILFDYGIHALLFGIAGQLGVVVFQVVLAIGAALSLVYSVRRVFRSDVFAVVVGLIYGLLPQSIAFPHQLLTESIANPLIVMGTAAFVCALTHPRRVSAWLVSGVLFGIGGAVRPALILLPLLALALTIVIRARPPPKGTAFFLAASLAPILGWCFFMLLQTGRFGLGDSGQDLGLNLADSVVKVLLSVGVGPADGTRPEWLPVRISLGEYFGYLREYPLGFLNLYFKNVLVMVADSGIGRLYVDLLGFGAEERLQLQDPVLGWRAQLTNHGVLAMLRQGFSVAPGTIVAGVIGAVVFACVNLGVLIAYLALFRSRLAIFRESTLSAAPRWLLAYAFLVPLYVIATSQIVAYAPSRHRSQGEFAWVLLACVGWWALRNWRAKPDPLRRLLSAPDSAERETVS